MSWSWTGVRDALQAKYWKATSPGFSSVGEYHESLELQNRTCESKLLGMVVFSFCHSYVVICRVCGALSGLWHTVAHCGCPSTLF